MNPIEIENIEINTLLDAIVARFGYDFRHYARASLKRRLARCTEIAGLDHISELLPRVLHDPPFFDMILRNLSITVTDMFRDPGFFAAFRAKVVPILRSFPFLKVWHPGCATGEEVYSTAIILKEEELYHRTQIYATDINAESIDRAKEGIFPLERSRQYSANYLKSGGKQSFSNYYHAKYESIKLRDDLKENITFANHNLTNDGVFGEMNVIICRNVLIYFDTVLQNHTLKLFDDSLCRNGFLCLGTRETLAFSQVSKNFRPTHTKMKIFQKTCSEGVNLSAGVKP